LFFEGEKRKGPFFFVVFLNFPSAPLFFGKKERKKKELTGRGKQRELERKRKKERGRAGRKRERAKRRRGKNNRFVFLPPLRETRCGPPPPSP
jgi:hypothetical protein